MLYGVDAKQRTDAFTVAPTPGGQIPHRPTKQDIGALAYGIAHCLGHVQFLLAASHMHHLPESGTLQQVTLQPAEAAIVDNRCPFLVGKGRQRKVDEMPAFVQDVGNLAGASPDGPSLGTAEAGQSLANLLKPVCGVLVR